MGMAAAGTSRRANLSGSVRIVDGHAEPKLDLADVLGFGECVWHMEYGAESVCSDD